MKFKVKRHWWIWALWIFWHAFTVRFFLTGIYLMVIATVIFDIFLVFPEASHFRYDITYRQLTVKRIIYPNISFPCDSIVAVEKPILNTARDRGGSGPIRWQSSLGAYKIIYLSSKNKKRKLRMPSVIISAKENQKFLYQLALNVNPNIKKEISGLLEDINANGNMIK